MARQDQRRWTRGVQEVRSLLGRLRGARGRLAATGDRPGGERSKSERDVREVLASLKQTARPLLAEAAQVSARRVRFDPDLEEPARLHVADGDARDPVRWSMTFGPSALSLRGPDHTRRLADGLRRGPLAAARASRRVPQEVSAEPDLLALIEQRWDWTPSVARLDQWSGDLIARFERFLSGVGSGFGVPELDDRFALRALDGAPPLVFEDSIGAGAGSGFGPAGDTHGAAGFAPASMGPSFFGGHVPSSIGSTGVRPSFAAFPTAGLPAVGRGPVSWPAAGGTTSFSPGAAPSTPFVVPASGGPASPRAPSPAGGGTTWRVAPTRGASLPSTPLTVRGVARPVSSGGMRGRTPGVSDAGATRRGRSGASTTFAAPPTSPSAATSGSAPMSLGMPTRSPAGRGAKRLATPTATSARAQSGAAPAPPRARDLRVRPAPTSGPGAPATSPGVAPGVGSRTSSGRRVPQPRVPEPAGDRRRLSALAAAGRAMLSDGLTGGTAGTAPPGGPTATTPRAQTRPDRLRRDRRAGPLLSLPGLAPFPERHPLVPHAPTMEDGRLRDDRRAPRSPAARPAILPLDTLREAVLPEALMEGLSRRQPLPRSLPASHPAAAGEPHGPLAPSTVPAVLPSAAVLPPATSAAPAIGVSGRMPRVGDRAPRRPLDANLLSRLGQALATPGMPRSTVRSVPRDRDALGAERRHHSAVPLPRPGFRPERLPGALLGRLLPESAAMPDLARAATGGTNAPRFPLSHGAAPWRAKLAPEDRFRVTPGIAPAVEPEIGTLGARAQHFHPVLDPERGHIPAMTRSAPSSIGLTRGTPKPGLLSPLQTIAPAFGDEGFTPRLARQPSIGHRVNAPSRLPRSEAFGVVPGRPPARPVPEPPVGTTSSPVADAATPGTHGIDSRLGPRPPQHVRPGEPAAATSVPLGPAIRPSRHEPRAGMSAAPAVEPLPAALAQFPTANATTAPRAGAIPDAIARRATGPSGMPTAAVPAAPVSSDHHPPSRVGPSTPWISEPSSLIVTPGALSHAAALPRRSSFLDLVDIGHTPSGSLPSGPGAMTPFLPMLQPERRRWAPRALEPWTLRTAVRPGSSDVNHSPVQTSLRTPEMRFVAAGTPASRNAPATRSDSRFLSPHVETPFGEPEDERDRRHPARVFRAEVGRDHRPVPTPLTGASTVTREERRPRVEIPDLDHLASRVYGRIKQQLAVERERRGFVR